MTRKTPANSCPTRQFKLFVRMLSGLFVLAFSFPSAADEPPSTVLSDADSAVVFAERAGAETSAAPDDDVDANGDRREQPSDAAAPDNDSDDAKETEESTSDKSLLTIERIYDSDEFNAESPNIRWLEADDYPSSTYITFDEAEDGGRGRDVVLHDPASGDKKVLVPAAEFIPGGRTTPLRVESHAWSGDLSKLLIYTNSKRVWRSNTRGDYWVLDRSARQLYKLGGDAPPASLMFAKFSPSGHRVAYVRERDIYVEDLVDRSIARLTHSPSENIINGTTDWVYEEEFFLRDAFLWSPDGEAIAYWQINTEGVERYPLVNHTDSLYPKVTWFAYPKTGQQNPACRVGVVQVDSQETNWIELPGDPREHYIPRMEWVGESNQVLVQQFNRPQNENRVFLADARGDPLRELFKETDQAWVDVHDELFWLDDGERFTWISDRDGWRHAYLVSLSGDVKLLTPGDFDVIRLLHVDQRDGVIYFLASPDNPTQRYLYRANSTGGHVQRVTPDGQSGTHDYSVSPDGRWAIHQHSSANHPPRWDLVSLPDHQTCRELEDNEALIEKIERLATTPVEFIRVDIGGGVELDAWCIKPPDFDPEEVYPLLIYVYGEPAGQTVVDRWGGDSYLWHAMLAQRGYVVMSFDNRGTQSPRGREFRKSMYRQIGMLGPKDQAAAVRAVLEERSYLDPERVGIWGWSGGGSSTLHALFKFPDVYRMGIAVAPVPNQRYYDTIYQERYMGLPSKNVEGYRAGSPINFASALEGDLLLVHGTGDDNCHYQTVEMLIDELVAHDKAFDMMIYPNRTHAIRERRNTTLHLRRLMTRFVEENLPAEASALVK